MKKDKILEFAKSHKVFKSSDLVKFFNNKFSRQYVARFLNELVSEQKLFKDGSTKSSTYSLPENAAYHGKGILERFTSKNAEEHKIQMEIEKALPNLKNLPENVKSIFDYAFSEMVNNAIEHSKTKFIDISVQISGGKITFTVRDFGVGVFRNVMRKRKLKSETEAIQDLLKGKTTTAPKAHSGEGIFFTSKIADIFELESLGWRMVVDNKVNDVFIFSDLRSKKGTLVKFSIGLKSKKHLINIFKEYQSSEKTYLFDKTKIRINLYTLGTIYVSRSQARRVLAGLDRFKLVILDFDKVPTVGQAFADEVFRIFKSAHSETKIQTINTNEAIDFMINRSKDNLKNLPRR